jgi:ABC-type Mn2+/Zn2+ transport system ATPase subunit
LTVILVTHDLEAVAHEVMHIACLDKTLFFHQSVEGFLKNAHTITHTHV